MNLELCVKPIPELSAADMKRFWEKVDKSNGPDSCWIWQSVKCRHGYGNFRIGEKKYQAHRVSFFLSGGTLTDGPLILHGPCNRRDCVNPKHLSAGTHSQNIADMDRDGTMFRGKRHYSFKNPEKVRRGDDHWSRKNPERRVRGSRMGAAKLTEDQVLEIRERYKNGEYGTLLAERFGVSQTLISAIITRKAWKHI